MLSARGSARARAADHDAQKLAIPGEESRERDRQTLKRVS
jgi:hypothetical protein